MMSKLARKTPSQIRENLFKEISPGCRELLEKCNQKFPDRNPKKSYEVHRLHDPKPKVTAETEAINQYIGEMSRGCSGHISSYAIKQDAIMHDKMIKQIIDWHRKGVESLKDEKLDLYERYKHINILDLPPAKRIQKIQSIVDNYQAQIDQEGFSKRISREHVLGYDKAAQFTNQQLTQMQIQNIKKQNEALFKNYQMSPEEEEKVLKEIKGLYDLL